MPRECHLPPGFTRLFLRPTTPNLAPHPPFVAHLCLELELNLQELLLAVE